MINVNRKTIAYLLAFYSWKIVQVEDIISCATALTIINYYRPQYR